MNVNDFVGSGVFWAAASALVALAVAIGSVVTLTVSAMIKRRDQPEADWAVHLQGRAVEDSAYGELAGFHCTGSIANAGDGAAFRLELRGKHCDAGLAHEETFGTNRVAVMGPGDIVHFWMRADLDRWESAEGIIEWTVPPTRLKKRVSLSLKLAEHMDKPGVQYTDPDTGVLKMRPLSS